MISLCGAFLRSLPISIIALLIFSCVGYASEQMTSARPLESGKLGISIYGTKTTEKDLQFHLRGSDLIQVPLQGGGTAQFFSRGNTDLKFQGESRSTIAKITWRPFDGLQYALTAGLGDFELKIPSGPVTNHLQNTSPGTILGAGLSWTVMTNTPVTPAVAVSLGYTRSDYKMGRLKSGGNAPLRVDQKFSLEEWQAGVAVSRRWKKWEPSAGLRFLRHTSTLWDLSAAEKVKGTRNGISPYANLRWEFLPKESLVLEVSGVDEIVLAAGLAIGF